MIAAHPIDQTLSALQRARRAIVVVDVVESVRLIAHDELGTIDRWRRFVNEVRTQVLPAFGGRMVKSLGDGMLLEFESVPAAIAAALQVQNRIAPYNAGLDRASAMLLRLGLHVGDVVVDALDIYGAGVNLAARMATLAGPGEIVASTEVCDELVAGLDAEVDDLGACYLKHLDQPVRAYRMSAPGRRDRLRAVEAEPPAQPMQPVIAILPFEPLGTAAEHHVAGELLADSAIASLSANPALRVISRLSTSAIRGRAHSALEVARMLGASYVVSGTFHVQGSRLLVSAEMAEGRSAAVVWADRITVTLDDIFQRDSEAVDHLSDAVLNTVIARERQRANALPLPTLEGFSLQLAGMSMMHRVTLGDFARARDILEHLSDRYPRAPTPRAWLAKWYVLRVTRGLVEDLAAESARALEQTRRALDADPGCSLALAMEGFVHCHMLRDLDAADTRLVRAIELNPNDSMAWLFRCVTQAFRGDGAAALDCGERALSLSPLDPLRHYYDALVSTAALAAGQLDRTIELAERSLRVNRNHIPTLRALAIAQVESGHEAAARRTVQRVLALEPRFTVREYLERNPRGGLAHLRERYGRALQSAGVPLC